VLALVAEAGHLLAALDEWPQWIVRGLFQTVAAAAQGVLLAALVVGPGWRAIRRGAYLNLLLALLWVFSRTAGVPSVVTLHRLPVGPLDALTALVEVAAGALLLSEWYPVRRRFRLPTQMPAATAEPNTPA
jgi:hypothetical protein